MKVYLGGTLSGSKWREELIPKLLVDYCNPDVDNHMPDVHEEITREKWEECEIHLYCFTPKDTEKMINTALMMESLVNSGSGSCVMCVLDNYEEKHFSKQTKNELDVLESVVEAYNGIVCHSIEEAAAYINVIPAIVAGNMGEA